MPKRNIDELEVVGDSILSEKRTIAWKICNFADLEHKRGECVSVGALPCHGHSWTLKLYPRGTKKSSKERVYVSAYLCLKSKGQVKVSYAFRLGTSRKSRTMTKVFNSTTSTDNWGCKNFRKRRTLLDKLDKGNLLVEVEIELHSDATQPLMPQNTLAGDMLRMLESGTKSDVSFLVDGEVFRAHSNILAMRAPTLAELAEDVAPGAHVPLEGVDKAVFNVLLRNVYAGEHPAGEIMEHKYSEILDAADRFGCTNLKLLAESKLVEKGATTETAAELILLADAKSCALLKESALNYFKANAAAVMRSPGWENVKTSAALLSEIMETVHGENSCVEDQDDGFGAMSVADLRRQLQKKGLSEDGTREMLVSRLKAEDNSAKKRRRTTS